MPVIADALWPKPNRLKKRAITEDEHRLIIEAEKNPEQRDYYEMLWLTGGSQTDIAMLVAENVNRKLMLLIYQRCKRRADDPPSRLRIGPKLKALLIGCRSRDRYFQKSGSATAVITRPNFGVDARPSASRACRFIHIVTRGRSGPRR